MQARKGVDTLTISACSTKSFPSGAAIERGDGLGRVHGHEPSHAAGARGIAGHGRCPKHHDLERCIAVGKYYRILGKSVSRRDDRELWEFHRKALTEVGYPMNRRRVAASVTPEEAVQRPAGLVKRRRH